MTKLELTILMPCLNEAETLARCVSKAKAFLVGHHIAGEVLIADNGSSDGSQDIAREAGARVVQVDEKGYGAALRGGIEHAKGVYVIMGDADDSYDFSNLMPFVEKLRDGFDLVMGNRFKGGIDKGAMPFSHRYLGNPVLTLIGKVFFHNHNCGDFHCGLRGFNRQRVLDLELQTTGMEFATEMVMKATLYRLKTCEVPTTLSPDGRSRPPHLRTWRDGWRHLRFMLLYCPSWLFLLPGVFFSIAGLVTFISLATGPKIIFGIGFDIHTMLYGAFSLLVGLQILFSFLVAKSYAVGEKLMPPDRWSGILFYRGILEWSAVFGVVAFLTGFMLSVGAVTGWGRAGFSSLDPAKMMRQVIPAGCLMAMGIQVFFHGFLLGITQLGCGKDAGR
ncbi:MAG: glycosyltransferase family 2 protein [Lentisphaeria bacterium]|nr:glycosyltransferase family 2 protein [Lentisphaeria bacterium]